MKSIVLAVAAALLPLAAAAQSGSTSNGDPARLDASKPGQPSAPKTAPSGSSSSARNTPSSGETAGRNNPSVDRAPDAAPSRGTSPQ